MGATADTIDGYFWRHYTIYELSRGGVSDVQRYDMDAIVGHMIYRWSMMNCNPVLLGNQTIECFKSIDLCPNIFGLLNSLVKLMND